MRPGAVAAACLAHGAAAAAAHLVAVNLTVGARNSLRGRIESALACARDAAADAVALSI